MTPERHPMKRDSLGAVPIGKALAAQPSTPTSQPALPSTQSLPDWQARLAEIGAILTQEAIDRRVKLADPQEQYRLERLIHETTETLSPEAVRVAIKEHRQHSPFMPALCDLMQRSADWRREKADDARRAAVAREAASRPALPKPTMPEAEHAAYRQQVIAELLAKANPPQAKPAGGGDDARFMKPPERSDLTPQLRAWAISQGIAPAQQQGEPAF
jgi:hypothetical protein